MSKVTCTEEKVWRINGRSFYLPHLVSISQGDYSYEFKVTHQNGMTFVVWGGKASGGSADQWYCDWPNGKKAKCSSLVDALKMLNGM
jgi:hypothetical protein